MTKGKQITLGVVAICQNEEIDLPWFLKNVLPWSDEVVLVDSGSTDNTVEIAKSAGNKVVLIEHRMTESGGFATQRNLGIQTSTCDWIIHMDIDERVTPEFVHEVKLKISNTSLNGFRYIRLNFFTHRLMKGGGWTGWNHPQLARKGCHEFMNNLHEKCHIKGGPNTIEQLYAKIWHLNDESYNERLSKSFRYAQIEAKNKTGEIISFKKILISPILEFIKKYIFFRGFLDGVPGLISAIHAADSVFRTNALLWDEQNRIPRKELEDQIEKMWQSYNQSDGRS